MSKFIILYHLLIHSLLLLNKHPNLQLLLLHINFNLFIIKPIINQY